MKLSTFLYLLLRELPYSATIQPESLSFNVLYLLKKEAIHYPA